MPDDNRDALIRLRLEQSQKCLEAAVLLADADAYRDAANRSYYCIFHAMRAMLAFDRFDSKRHSGILSAFSRRYIKTEVFPKDFSRMIYSAFEVRNDSDYDDFYVVSKAAVTEQIENAKTILTAVEAYISSAEAATASQSDTPSDDSL